MIPPGTPIAAPDPLVLRVIEPALARRLARSLDAADTITRAAP